jgi:transposase
VKKFLEDDKERQIYFAKIPPYCPMLNADEQVWQTLKDDMLKNVICKNLTELKKTLENAFEELKTQTQKIANFCKHQEVAFYKSYI